MESAILHRGCKRDVRKERPSHRDTKQAYKGMRDHGTAQAGQGIQDPKVAEAKRCLKCLDNTSKDPKDTQSKKRALRVQY